MKKLLFLIAVFALMLGLTSTTYAKEKLVKNQKADLYHVMSGSSNYPVPPPYAGHVTIVDPMGSNDLIINGVIQGLLTNTQYDVWVRKLISYSGPYLNSYPPLGYYMLVQFTTDEYGNGNFHIKIPDMYLEDETYQIQVAINYAPSGGIGSTVAATDWEYLANTGLTVTVKTPETTPTP